MPLPEEAAIHCLMPLTITVLSIYVAAQGCISFLPLLILHLNHWVQDGSTAHGAHETSLVHCLDHVWVQGRWDDFDGRWNDAVLAGTTSKHLTRIHVVQPDIIVFGSLDGLQQAV